MHRLLTSPKCRLFTGLVCLSVFLYTKISSIENDLNDGVIQMDTSSLHPQLAHTMQMSTRSSCQIVYVLGVEGSIHHGFTPVLQSLALKQTDTTGQTVEVKLQPRALRAALFGRFGERRALDDPSLIADTLVKLCPDDGKKHILIEDSSFPCGQEGDLRGYRYPRQHVWLNMTMNEIASSELALEHPVKLFKFVELYGMYADIKFVVLHRPFLETVASHKDWDESVLRHSNLIRGFMLILRRFLDEHNLNDMGNQMWIFVCVEMLMSQFYQYEYESDQGAHIDKEALGLARQNIMAYLAEFLGWSQRECLDCFDSWREGSTNKVETLKDEDIMPLLDQMKEIEMVWPPPMHQNKLQVQQCST